VEARPSTLLRCGKRDEALDDGGVVACEVGVHEGHEQEEAPRLARCRAAVARARPPRRLARAAQREGVCGMGPSLNETLSPTNENQVQTLL
jgi:hypothetical protein